MLGVLDTSVSRMGCEASGLSKYAQYQIFLDIIYPPHLTSTSICNYYIIYGHFTVGIETNFFSEYNMIQVFWIFPQVNIKF